MLYLSAVSSDSLSRYKWYILALGSATHMFGVGMSQMCMPVLFEEISIDLGLDLAQVGIIWGFVSLPGLFASLFAGMLMDRYGAKRSLAVACLLQGVFSALRGVSTGFFSLAVVTFFFGLLCVPLGFATHKAAGYWFSGRQLGLANGILAMGMGVGFTLGSMLSATVMSPLLGGWRNVMFLYGAITIIIGILWAQSRQPHGHEDGANEVENAPFWQALLHVLRNKSAWLIGLNELCNYSFRMGILGYLPTYLRRSGWTAVAADGAVSALNTASVLGVVPLSILSDRTGLRKPIIYAGMATLLVGASLLTVSSGWAIWPLAVLIGLFFEAITATEITMITETEGIDTRYSGTALGLLMSLGGVGGFIGPAIGNRLAVANPNFAFIFWAVLAAVALLLFRMVKETGWRRKEPI